MASQLKNGTKNNSRRKGVPSQLKAQRRVEAEARQKKYDALPLAKKLEGAGAREKARLLAKSQK